MRPFSRSGGEFVNRAQLGQSARCNSVTFVMTLKITSTQSDNRAAIGYLHTRNIDLASIEFERLREY